MQEFTLEEPVPPHATAAHSQGGFPKTSLKQLPQPIDFAAPAPGAGAFRKDLFLEEAALRIVWTSRVYLTSARWVEELIQEMNLEQTFFNS